MELGPETQLCERYFLLREEPETMGSSLFGRVWTALDVDTDEVVRVVVVDPELLPTEEARTAFLKRMGEVVEKMPDALVPLKDVGREGDDCILFFGAPQGTMPLPDIIAEMTPEARAEEARRFAVHLARSISDLHRSGVVHGLLDPSTVFEWERGYAVWQYEIARLCERDVIEIRLAGSPMDAYRAPEATVGDDLVPASDIYSWAAMVAQFPAQDSVYEAITRIHDEGAKQVFGEPLVALLIKALSEDPNDRPTDGPALVAALEQAGLTRDLAISRAGTGNSVWEWELTRERRRQQSLDTMANLLGPSERSWEPSENDQPTAEQAELEAALADTSESELDEQDVQASSSDEQADHTDDDTLAEPAASESPQEPEAETEPELEADTGATPEVDYGDYAPDVTEGLEDDDLEEVRASSADEAVAEVVEDEPEAVEEDEVEALAAEIAASEERLEASRQSEEAREKLEAAIRLAARQAAQRRAELQEQQARAAAEAEAAAQEPEPEAVVEAPAQDPVEELEHVDEVVEDTPAASEPATPGLADADDGFLAEATRRASEQAAQERERLAEWARTQTTPDVGEDYETPSWALEAAERAAREVAEEAAREAAEEAAREAAAQPVDDDDDDGMFDGMLVDEPAPEPVVESQPVLEPEPVAEPEPMFEAEPAFAAGDSFSGPLPPMIGEDDFEPEPIAAEPIAESLAEPDAPRPPALNLKPIESSPEPVLPQRGAPSAPAPRESSAERSQAEKAAQAARERVRRQATERRKPSGRHTPALSKRASVLDAPPETWGADEPSLAMPITAPAVAEAMKPAARVATPEPAPAPAPVVTQTIITESSSMTPALKAMVVLLFLLLLWLLFNR